LIEKEKKNSYRQAFFPTPNGRGEGVTLFAFVGEKVASSAPGKKKGGFQSSTKEKGQQLSAQFVTHRRRGALRSLLIHQKK